MATCRLNQSENEEAEEEEEDNKKDLSGVDPELLTTIKVLRHVVARDPLAADLQLSLFASAVFSQRYATLAQPMPREYDRPGGIHELMEVLDAMPGLRPLVEGAPSVALAQPIALYLLRWLLTPVTPPPQPKRSTTSLAAPSSETSLVEVPEFAPSATLRAMARPPASDDCPRPSYLFEVIHPILDEAWNDMARGKKIVSGFIGGPLDIFFSTVHCGVRPGGNMLKIHRNLQDALEDSTEGFGLASSELGASLCCVAEVECVMEVPGLAVVAMGNEQHLVLRDGKLARVTRLYVFKCDEEEPPPNWSQAWKESAAKGMASGARSFHRSKSAHGFGGFKLPEFKFEIELGGDQQRGQSEDTDQSYDDSGPSDGPGGPEDTPEDSSKEPDADSAEKPDTPPPRKGPKLKKSKCLQPKSKSAKNKPLKASSKDAPEKTTPTSNNELDASKDSQEKSEDPTDSAEKPDTPPPRKGPKLKKSKCMQPKLKSAKNKPLKASSKDALEETTTPTSNNEPDASKDSQEKPEDPADSAEKTDSPSSKKGSKLKKLKCPAAKKSTAKATKTKRETATEDPTGEAETTPTPPRYQPYRPKPGSSSSSNLPAHAPRPADGTVLGKEVRQEPTCVVSFIRNEVSGDASQKTIYYGPFVDSNEWKSQNEMSDVSKRREESFIDSFIAREQPGPSPEEIEEIRSEMQKILAESLFTHDISNYESAAKVEEQLANIESSSSCEEEMEIVREEIDVVQEDIERSLMNLLSAKKIFKSYKPKLQNDPSEIHLEDSFSVYESPSLMAEELRKEMKLFVTQYSTFEFTRSSQHESENEQPETRKISPTKCPNTRSPFTIAEGQRSEEKESFVREFSSSELPSDSDPDVDEKVQITIAVNFKMVEKKSRQEVQNAQLRQLQEQKAISTNECKCPNKPREEKKEIQLEETHPASNSNEKFKNVSVENTIQIKKEPDDSITNEASQTDPEKDTSNALSEKAKCTCYTYACKREREKELDDEAGEKEELETCYTDKCMRDIKEELSDQAVEKEEQITSYSPTSSRSIETNKSIVVTKEPVPLDSSSGSEVLRHPLDDFQDIESTLSVLTSESISARFPESTHESEEDIRAQVRQFAMEDTSEDQANLFGNMIFCPRCIYHTLTMPPYTSYARENRKNTGYCRCNKLWRPRYGQETSNRQQHTVTQVPIVSSRYLEGLIMAMFVWAVVSLFYTGRNDSGYGII